NKVTLTNNTATKFGGTSTTGDNLIVLSSGAITQPTGKLTVTGTSSFTATGGISLGSTTNALSGSITLVNNGSGDAALSNAAHNTLDSSSSAGAFNVTAIGGYIKQSNGSGITTGDAVNTSTFITHNGGATAITLDQGGNNHFAGPVSLQALDAGNG